MQFRIQPVLQPNGAPFWSPILLIMSMTVATTPTIAMTIVTGTSAFIDAASGWDAHAGLLTKLGLLALHASTASEGQNNDFKNR